MQHGASWWRLRHVMSVTVTVTVAMLILVQHGANAAG
jgi:hypothetical protein